jgi:RND family efflux transporter MFP subunit
MTINTSSITSPLGRVRKVRRGLPGPRRALLLAALVLATAAGAYLLYARLLRDNDASTPPFTTATAARQTLASTTSASGTVAASRQVKLSPQSAGRLSKLSVKQGDAVQAGQELAALDAATLEIKRDTAASQLAAAQSRLDALLAGPTAADVAAQQQAVASAQSTLTRAQNDLRNLLTGSVTPQDIAAAQANLDRTRAALDVAQQNYDKLVRGEDLTLRPEYATLQTARANYQQALTTHTNRSITNPADVVAARQAVQSGQASVDAAQARLTALMNPNPSDVSSARSSVQSAQAGLDAATAKLHALINPIPADIAAAQAVVDSAQSALEAAKARYASVYLGGTHADRVAAQAAVDAARASLDSALARRQAALGATPSSAADIAAADAAVAQAQSALITAQNNLNKLLGETVGPNIAAAEQTVHSAESTLTNARTNLHKLLTPPAADLAAAQQGVQTAQAQLTTAQSNLARLLTPQPADVLAAEQQVQSAQSTLAQAQGSLDKLLNPNPADVAQTQAALDSARAAMDTAQTNWDRITNLIDLDSRTEATALRAARSDYQNALATYVLKTQGPKPGDIETLRAQIESARASLDAAQKKLAQVQAGPLQTDIDQQQEAVNQLVLSLKSAQSDLDAAVVRAPFAGTITQISAAEGDQIGAGTAIMTLLDPSLIQISASLDESSVGKVKAGQSVTVAFDALPGTVFTGQIAGVTPAGTSSQGVVTFPITVVFDPRGTPIAAGLTANLTITTERKENALAVPSRAVKRQGPQTTVDVIGANGAVENRPVRTGLTGNGGQIEIVSGLNEGDRVAVPAPQGGSGNARTGGDQFFAPAGARPASGPGGPVQIVIGGP